MGVFMFDFKWNARPKPVKILLIIQCRNYQSMFVIFLPFVFDEDDENHQKM
jgi:hypothetical protein